VKVVSWAELEGVWVWWEKREDICQGTGNIEEFLNLLGVSRIPCTIPLTYQSNPVDLHALMRELRSHGYQVSRNINRILERHTHIVVG